MTPREPFGPSQDLHLSNNIPRIKVELHYFGEQQVLNNYITPILNEGAVVKINKPIKDMRDHYHPREKTGDGQGYTASVDITQYCLSVSVNDTLSPPYNTLSLQLEMPHGLQHYIFQGHANSMYGAKEEYSEAVFKNIKAGGWITAKIQDNNFNDDRDNEYQTFFLGKIDNIQYGLSANADNGISFQSTISVACSSFIQPLIQSQFKVDTSADTGSDITVNSLLSVSEYTQSIIDPISKLATEPTDLGETFYRFFRFFSQMPVPASVVEGGTKGSIRAGGFINPLSNIVLAAYDNKSLQYTPYGGNTTQLPKVSAPRAIGSAISKSSIWKFLINSFCPDPMVFECFTTMVVPYGNGHKEKIDNMVKVYKTLSEGEKYDTKRLDSSGLPFSNTTTDLNKYRAEAIKNSYLSLNAVPTIIFRLKPLKPEDDIILYAFLDYYRNSIKGNLQTEIDKAPTLTASERYPFETGLAAAQDADSVMILPRERIVSMNFSYSEQNKFNAVYVDDIFSSGNQSRINKQAANKVIPKPVYDVDDININGLRVYDVSFPFTSFTDTESVADAVNLPSSLGERAFMLSANDNEYSRGIITMKYYPKNYLTQGLWGAILMNEENEIVTTINKTNRGVELEDLRWFMFYIDAVSKSFTVNPNTGEVEGMINIQYSRGAYGQKRNIFIPGRK